MARVLPQPPPDLDPPPAVRPILRIGPLLLIPASILLAALSLIVAEALRWSNPFDGLMGGAIMVLVFGLPLWILAVVIQSVLGLVFMSRRRRSWWRTLIVTSPSALLVLVSLVSIVGLYPPERRARRELGRYLGGHLPASVDHVRLNYAGGIDPSWSFEFSVDPLDYAEIRNFRNYEPSMRSPRIQFHEVGRFYYLDYDSAGRRCRFDVVAY